MKTESDGEADNEEDEDSSSENEMAHLPVRYCLGFTSSFIPSWAAYRILQYFISSYPLSLLNFL